MDTQLIIISNTCVGLEIYRMLNLEYTSPFIGTLIPNDNDYLKLCKNITYYINIQPTVRSDPKDNTIFAIQNKDKYFRNRNVYVPYPVIYLDDIEIHCIHETSNEIALDKFIRRRQRMLDVMQTKKYIIVNTLVYSEFINDHEDYGKIINKFLTNKKHINIFIGPPKYNTLKNKTYIEEPWDNMLLERDSSHIINWNNQNNSKVIFTIFIQQHIINNLLNLT